jgi:hypothetical protein
MCIHVQAKDVLPQGMWEVEQVSIEKNTDERTDNKVYRKQVHVPSYIRFPQKWEIKDSVTIVLHYDDGVEDIAFYELKGRQLSVHAPEALQTYQCDIKDNMMTLIIRHHYYNNLPSGRTEQIKEHWTVVLLKTE